MKTLVVPVADNPPRGRNLGARTKIWYLTQIDLLNQLYSLGRYYRNLKGLVSVVIAVHKRNPR